MYRINQVLRDVRPSFLFDLTTLWSSIGRTLLSLFLSFTFLNLFVNSGFRNSNHQLINWVAFNFILPYPLKTFRALFSHLIVNVTFWTLEHRNNPLLNCLYFFTLLVLRNYIVIPSCATFNKSALHKHFRTKLFII